MNSTSNDLEKLLNTYQLPEQAPKEIISDINRLTEFVFEKCLHLIPQEIVEFFYDIGEYSSFKNELIWHLKINAYMIQHNKIEENIKPTGALIARIYDFYSLEIANDREVINLFGNKDVPRIAQDHLKKTYPSNIQAFSLPLTLFQAVHVDSHKVLKDYKNNQHTLNYLNQQKDISQKLHLHFYGNFKYLLDNFHSIENIERFFKDNKLTLHSALNRILFELEYPLGLANKVAILIKSYPIELKQKFLKLLSIFGLLPNVNGRLYYLTFLFHPSINGKGKINNTLILDERIIRLKKFRTALIGMGVVTIPVMEIYLQYFLEQGITSGNLTVTEEFLEDFVSSYYSDEIITPFYGKFYGAHVGLNWQLSDIDFDEIQGILKELNKVMYIKKNTLNDIFKEPHLYLKKNGYDECDLYLLDKDRIVEVISEVVEEKYFYDL